MTYLHNLYPTIDFASAERGAPMGRSNWSGKPEGEVTLYKLPLDAQGYDLGGAYWGLPSDLYYAVDDGGKFRCFTRANSVQEARRNIWSSGYKGPLSESVVIGMANGYLTAMLQMETIETEDRDSEYYDTTFWEANFTYAAITQEVTEQALKDCEQFLKRCSAELLGMLLGNDYYELGFLFWATRQGHGIGFLDNPKKWGGVEMARQLRGIADFFGEVYPYLNDKEEVAV